MLAPSLVYPSTKPVPVKPRWAVLTAAPPRSVARSASSTGLAATVIASRLTLPVSPVS